MFLINKFLVMHDNRFVRCTSGHFDYVRTIDQATFFESEEAAIKFCDAAFKQYDMLSDLSVVFAGPVEVTETVDYRQVRLNRSAYEAENAELKRKYGIK